MRKNKLIKVYVLDLIMDPEHPEPHTLTIAPTKKDAEEYAHLWLRNSLLPQYQEWAESYDLDWEAWSTWKFFFNLQIPDNIKQTLKIKCLKYRFNDIMAVFRMFSACEPLGCSFETPIEEQYYECIHKLDNIGDKIPQELKDLLSEIESEDLNSDDQQR